MITGINYYIRNKLLNEYGSGYEEKIKADKKFNTYEYLYVRSWYFCSIPWKGCIQRKTKIWYKKILLFGIDCAAIDDKIIDNLRYGDVIPTINFKERIVK